MTTVDVGRDFVGYGANPPPVTWPGGKKVALSVVLNYEEGAEPALVDGDAWNEPRAELPPAGDTPGRDFSVETYYEYGSRSGFWRLARIVDELDVPVTVFACGRALERNAAVAHYLGSSRHEVCSHGYRWMRPSQMTEAEEREEIANAVRAIEQTTGRRPVGWYSRYAPSERTRALLAEHGGFLYDSDSYADDLPYQVDVAGRPRLVVPYSLDNNDIKFWAGQGFGGPADFADHLRRGLRQLCGEPNPSVMSVGLHARIAGRPARASAVREFLEFALELDQVWFCTRADLAQHWLDQTKTAAGRQQREEMSCP